MRAAVLIFALFLTSCAQGTMSSSTPESQLFLACKAFSTTEKNLAVHANSLTDDQVVALAEAFNIVTPICTKEVARVEDPIAALRAVNRQLERLLEIERSVVTDGR